MSLLSQFKQDSPQSLASNTTVTKRKAKNKVHEETALGPNFMSESENYAEKQYSVEEKLKDITKKVNECHKNSHSDLDKRVCVVVEH